MIKMKPIIFRGMKLIISAEDLINKKNKWAYGSLVYDTTEQPYIVGWWWKNNDDCVFGYWEPVNPETIGQFIGVYDRNNTKIYVGDIIQYKYYLITQRWTQPHNMKKKEQIFQQKRNNWSIKFDYIGFQDGMFTCNDWLTVKHIKLGEYFERGTKDDWEYERRAWDFEVAGNIYENSELLIEKEGGVRIGEG